MKKFLPYILGALLLVGLVFLVMTAKKPQRIMDERVTLKQKDKIPYGFYVARKMLPSLFPFSKITSDKNEPGEWFSINKNQRSQAVFLVGRQFNPSVGELRQITDFVKAGNYVYVIAQSLNYNVREGLGLDNEISMSGEINPDSVHLYLVPPKFSRGEYVYPGRYIAGNFINTDATGNYVTSDASASLVLGKNSKALPNFIQLRVGAGSLFINLAPAAFTNYFLLYNNNINYYEKAVSVIPLNVSRVVWNDYYLSKIEKENEPNWLGVLFRYEAFRWALLTALFTIIIFMLMEMRRRQRYIPVYEKPKNETLDFVQTIGRLYYDKKDHLDLARKLGAYFLDHVREKYRLQTENLDNEFISALHFKTSYPLKNLQQIISFILFTRQAEAISEYQLSRFHEQLETFYKNN
jgi:hypothetical protein